jgi:hypothetical protein
MAQDTTRLLELLKTETFPLRYVHKFIGRNTPAFRAAVAELGKRFPSAVCEGFRESGDSHAYLSYTYVQTAADAPEVVAFVEATAALADIKIIL